MERSASVLLQMELQPQEERRGVESEALLCNDTGGPTSLFGGN